MSVEKIDENREFLNTIKPRYELFDQESERYISSINALLSQKAPIDELKKVMLDSDCRKVMNLSGEFITALSMLKISETEYAVGESPVIHACNSISELAYLDRIVSLYLYRMEFDWESETYRDIAQIIKSDNLSCIYLAEKIAGKEYKRKNAVFEKLIATLSDTGCELVAMKLEALKSRYILTNGVTNEE